MGWENNPLLQMVFNIPLATCVKGLLKLIGAKYNCKNALLAA